MAWSRASGSTESPGCALEEQPYGGVLLVAAGLAFLAFGVYCGLIALHGEIDNAAAVHGSLEET